MPYDGRLVGEKREKNGANKRSVSIIESQATSCGSFCLDSSKATFRNDRNQMHSFIRDDGSANRRGKCLFSQQSKIGASRVTWLLQQNTTGPCDLTDHPRACTCSLIGITASRPQLLWLWYHNVPKPCFFFFFFQFWQKSSWSCFA